MFNIRLQRARKACGLSLRALGDKVGVSHTAVKKYEDGVAMPSSDHLLKLSKALNVRSEYFFRPETVTLEGIEYRKCDALPKKRLEAITYEITDYIERRLELESLLPDSMVSEFDPVLEFTSKIQTLEEAETAANQLRSAWCLGMDPILDLMDLVEKHGIRVFMIDTNVDVKFDGLAARANGKPIIVVSRGWPGDRQRFTLAHELGHLVLDGQLSDELDEEMACNRFAGAFLFPGHSLCQALGSKRSAIELKELALLKSEYGLSMAGILYRARDLQVISNHYHKSYQSSFQQKGWAIQEPGENYPAEKNHAFEQLLFHALAEEFIGESKAAELLGVSLQCFRRIRSMEAVNVTVD